jgi:hypothetical protein
MTLLAYMNDPQLKADIVEEIAKHRAADQIVKGHYGRINGKWTGCAVGCSIRSLNLRRGLKLPTDDHDIYETYLGIPRHLAKLEDIIFERLPDGRYLDWPGQFADAIRPGADLSMVWAQFALWMLTDAGFLRITDRNRDAINDVVVLYRRWVDTGQKPSTDDWLAARRAAAAAAAAYTDAAAAADADAAADAYADAAAAADAYADAAAAAAAAAYAAADAAADAERAWCSMADKLIELLRAA